MDEMRQGGDGRYTKRESFWIAMHNAVAARVLHAVGMPWPRYGRQARIPSRDYEHSSIPTCISERRTAF